MLSGVAHGSEQSEWLGLARALLLATRAQAMVVCLWAASDAACAWFARALHAHWTATGCTIGEAFAHAVGRVGSVTRAEHQRAVALTGTGRRGATMPAANVDAAATVEETATVVEIGRTRTGINRAPAFLVTPSAASPALAGATTPATTAIALPPGPSLLPPAPASMTGASDSRPSAVARLLPEDERPLFAQLADYGVFQLLGDPTVRPCYD
ncbi:MAG: hypothetical protein HY332_10150 [Chloroflexi bacterium]|nr:hypothetical protein [Chloroflexota bacterium]